MAGGALAGRQELQGGDEGERDIAAAHRSLETSGGFGKRVIQIA